MKEYPLNLTTFTLENSVKKKREKKMNIENVNIIHTSIVSLKHDDGLNFQGENIMNNIASSSEQNVTKKKRENDHFKIWNTQ